MSAQRLPSDPINPISFSIAPVRSTALSPNVSEANRILIQGVPAVNIGRFNNERARSRRFKAERKAVETAKTVRERLISIKSQSALTWDAIADLLGTSTRSLHLWRKGGNLAEENLMRLNSLDETLAFIDPGSGLRMKALLARIDNRTGLSVHDMLKSGDFVSVRSLVGKGRGRTETLPLTPEEAALFTPLSIPVLINQRRLDFYTS